MIQGRPIRFLVTTLGGWTALRLAMVLPVTGVMTGQQPQFADRSTPSAMLAAAFMLPGSSGDSVTAAPAPVRAVALREASFAPLLSAAVPLPGVTDEPAPEPPARSGGWSSAVADSLLGAQLAFARAPRPQLALASFAPGMGLTPAESGLPPAAAPSRWSGSAWMLWRGDDAPGYARGPRLSGSQTGMRVDYAVAPASALRPAFYGRASAALQGPAAAELAAGLAIRPRLPLPTVIAVERREALSDGGRSAFAVITAVGIDPVPIGAGFRLDGYGQAGLVGLQQRDGFVDGRLTVERPVVARPDVAVGAGLWGGAQPGASRLDIGPQASLRLRLGDANFRLGAEWRERVAGNAAPSSGPALSLGTDF